MQSLAVYFTHLYRVFGNLQQKWDKTMLKTGGLQTKGKTETEDVYP